ncbi:hypothetical protein IKZ40_01750 [bacterium]|nr:hypothetical protein [bacterium]
MKKLIFLCLVSFAAAASNIEQVVPPKEDAEPKTVCECPNCCQSDSGNYLFRCGEYSREPEADVNGFLPGFVNVLTCWLELPRAFTYEATARPRSMIVLAPLIGTSLTGLRALQGVGNILTLGLCDKFIRGDMPQFVWDALWLAREPESD